MVNRSLILVILRVLASGGLVKGPSFVSDGIVEARIVHAVVARR
jgi:hypothetical protein